MAVSPMDVSSRELAAALADRLNQIVPVGFTVRSEDVRVNVYRDGQDLGGSPALVILAERDERSVDEKIETAVQAVLSDIQDRIIEASKGPWPGESGHGADLPMPDCQVTGDRLRLWFGDENAPVISVAPIALR
jgi:hypothetical protein